MDDSGLSFECLYQQLQERICNGGVGVSILKTVLHEIGILENKFGKISMQNASNFGEAYELIFGLVNNLTTNREISWALGTPIPATIVAGTTSVYDLIGMHLKPAKEKKISKFYQGEAWPNELLYSLVLDRIYGIKSTVNPLIFEYKDVNKVVRYVKLEVDFSLVKVKEKSVLPEIDFSCLREYDMLNPKDVRPIIDSIHLDSFFFEGLSILRFQDCTDEFVARSFQNMIGNLSQYKRSDLVREIPERIKSIFGKSSLHSSLYPVLYLNGVPILKEEVAINSILFREDTTANHGEFQKNLLSYLTAPFILSYGIHADLDTRDSYLLQRIKRANVKSYVCCPLTYQEELVGFIELYTKDDHVLLTSELSHLSSFFPILTQLAFDLRMEFKNRLDDVILQFYTALQPAVQWRFNLAAANYLKNNEQQQGLIEEISFKDVFPIYGVIDVKDSTVLRNLAFRKDNRQRLASVKKLVSRVPIAIYPDMPAFYNFLGQIDKIAIWLTTDNMIEHMQEIIAFFQEEVPTFILTLSWLDPVLDQEIEQYAKTIGVNAYQSAFDESLNRVNAVISDEIVKLDSYVQSVFPSYFEKFRTDGVEYDFYIGQSISPTSMFKTDMLREIRKQQLISMVRINRTLENIGNTLPIALKTTQLIFVHASTIDISFRPDERRFDVEGGYNVRYQMIKKRIDKVLIRRSKERLVQPDMVAVVTQGLNDFYLLKEDMLLLAEQGLFMQGIEELELEELQGVSGLKALRARICTDFM